MASYTKTPQVLYDGQAAGNGNTYRTQTQYMSPVYQGVVHVTALVSTDTIQIQGSNDQVNWYNLGTAFNAPEMATVDAAIPYIRAVKTGTTARATVNYYG